MNGKKNNYGKFKQQTIDISYEKNWMWPKRGNVKRETESLLIAAPNDGMNTNYMKTRMDKTL